MAVRQLGGLQAPPAGERMIGSGDDDVRVVGEHLGDGFEIGAAARP